MLKLKTITQTVTALAAGIMLSASVQAQEIDNRPNVYGGVVDYKFDKDWNQENDFGWLLGGEARIGDRWGMALEQYNHTTAKDTGPGYADYAYSRLGGNYHLTPHGDWQPYISAGLGYGRLTNSIASLGVDENAFDFGLGVKRFFTEHMFVRGDAKAIRTSTIDTWDLALGLSVGYAFGPKPRPAPVAPPVVVDGDSDGDGVPDSRDKCPNTPRELAVDADGCPIMDSTMVRQELLVQFDFDKAEIKPEFYGVIDQFAQFMTTYTNTNAVIEGHTDSTGTDAYNQGLSERRAQAIVARLVSVNKIPASRLKAVGFGESRPRVANDTSANRAQNRRIMAQLEAQKQEQRRR